MVASRRAEREAEGEALRAVTRQLTGRIATQAGIDTAPTDARRDGFAYAAVGFSFDGQPATLTAYFDDLVLATEPVGCGE